MNAVSLPLMLPVAPRVVVAADHPLYRDALRRAVSDLCPGAEVDEAGELSTVVQLLEQGRAPMLLLLDLDMSSVRGLIGLQQVHSLHPELAVAVLSVNEDAAFVQRALAGGAAGFLPKSINLSDLSVALHCLLSGRCWTPARYAEAHALFVEEAQQAPEAKVLGHRLSMLTPQQVRIALLLAEGLLNKQIAHELAISENTVKVHVSTILHRLRLSNRTQVAVLVESMHLVNSEQGPTIGL